MQRQQRPGTMLLTTIDALSVPSMAYTAIECHATNINSRHNTLCIPLHVPNHNFILLSMSSTILY